MIGLKQRMCEMLNSDAKEQIERAIGIVNNLSDKEKKEMINEINKKIQPLQNDGTFDKTSKKALV